MKKSNPVIWACTCMMAAVGFGLIASLSGNPMPETPVELGMAGFFWGMVIAVLRNRGRA